MSQGNFVWYEYMAKDVDKAIAFYSETVGWKTAGWGDSGYTMWMVGEEGVGGVTTLPKEAAAMGAPPHWLASISTSDVDATAKRTAQLGGKVLREPVDMPNVGRYAVLQDPQGAVFSAIQFEGEGMPPVDGKKPGAFSWSELMSTNWEASFGFYSDVFGWEKADAMDMGEMGIYQMFSVNGEMAGGMMNKSEGMAAAGWLYYVTTDDIDAGVTRVKQSGGQLMHGPHDVPGGKVAVFLDNQGGAFAMHQFAKN